MSSNKNMYFDPPLAITTCQPIEKHQSVVKLKCYYSDMPRANSINLSTHSCRHSGGVVADQVIHAKCKPIGQAL